MRVTVSVKGRFHAFHLASQLHKHGCLQSLITSYPSWEVAKYGIPPERVRALLIQEIASRCSDRRPAALRRLGNPQFALHEWFDRAAASCLPDQTDLFVGWSSLSERSLKRLKQTGTVTIVVRGSAHIEYQHGILAKEYEKHGIRGDLPHPSIIAKEKREYQLADYIGIPSNFVRRTFTEQGIAPEKLIQVPYGVDLNEFFPEPGERSTFRVISAGALSIRKGTHYLLQAFAELKLPNAELWLIGPIQPEMAPFLRRYEGSYRYFSPVRQPQLRGYYSQCSVFAICSLEDGMGMVQLQAMATGLPVICTVNTGAEEIITDGREGFVIPICDGEVLKDRIRFLYDHAKLRREMGAAAHRTVQQGYSCDDYGQRIVRAYGQIAGHRAPQGLPAGSAS